MRQYFELRDGTLTQSESPDANVVVYAPPDDDEKCQLLENLKIDSHTLESALDPDEVSRVEFAPDHVFILWKRPNRAYLEQYLKMDVSSVGLFLQKDRLTVILAEDSNVPFNSREFGNVNSLTDVLLRLVLNTIRHYLDHLKAVRRLTTHLQAQVSKSMENESLLQMFGLSESLVYYLNALESNGMVLSRLRGGAEKLGLSPGQLAMLDDIMIDHHQCHRQAEVQSSVLSGLMDARGNIINNNMNILLKNLTFINVVFLPLNLIASIGGMSEYSMMTGKLDWRIAYLLFMGGMVVLGRLTWVYLVKRIEKNATKRAGS
jgi:magnesium transporter